MATLLFEEFGGIAPGISSHKRPVGTAERADNIDFTYGDLRGLPASALPVPAILEDTDPLHRKNIYQYRYFPPENPVETEKWLHLNSDNKVFFVPGPVPEDQFQRLYFSGEGPPQFNVLANLLASPDVRLGAYNLGIPAPEGTITVDTYAEVAGADEDATIHDNQYVYTFVSMFGEEGPPSAPSALYSRAAFRIPVLLIPADRPELIAGTSLAAPGMNGMASYKRRVYRVNPGSSVADFQFVKDLPVGGGIAGLTDDVEPELLGEVLPSETWIGPPDDTTYTTGVEGEGEGVITHALYPAGPLQGLLGLPGGVMAGFSGRTLCFSVPFLPHAWPLGNRINLTDTIVAIELVPSGLICLTTGLPRLITGSAPSGYTEQTIQSPYPCLNYDSVVNMGPYVLYSSSEGIVAIDGSGARVLTEGLISPQQWRSGYCHTEYSAVRYEGTYLAVACHGRANESFILDPRNGTVKISNYSDVVQAPPNTYRLYHDTATDEVYIARATVGAVSGVDIIVIEKLGGAVGAKIASRWHSTPIHLSNPIALTWMAIQFGTEQAIREPGEIGAFNVWVNGVEVPFLPESRIVIKRVNLPSLIEEVQIRITALPANTIIARIVLASSMEELKAAING